MPGLFHVCSSALSWSKATVSPSHGCQWGQISVTVSLVIPGYSSMECCSSFLLVFGQLKTLGKKSPEQAGLALLAASQQWERGG